MECDLPELLVPVGLRIQTVACFAEASATAGGAIQPGVHIPSTQLDIITSCHAAGAALSSVQVWHGAGNSRCNLTVLVGATSVSADSWTSSIQSILELSPLPAAVRAVNRSVLSGTAVLLSDLLKLQAAPGVGSVLVEGLTATAGTWNANVSAVCSPADWQACMSELWLQLPADWPLQGTATVHASGYVARSLHSEESAHVPWAVAIQVLRPNVAPVVYLDNPAMVLQAGDTALLSMASPRIYDANMDALELCASASAGVMLSMPPELACSSQICWVCAGRDCEKQAQAVQLSVPATANATQATVRIQACDAQACSESSVSLDVARGQATVQLGQAKSVTQAGNELLVTGMELTPGFVAPTLPVYLWLAAPGARITSLASTARVQLLSSTAWNTSLVQLRGQLADLRALTQAGLRTVLTGAAAQGTVLTVVASADPAQTFPSVQSFSTAQGWQFAACPALVETNEQHTVAAGEPVSLARFLGVRSLSSAAASLHIDWTACRNCSYGNAIQSGSTQLDASPAKLVSVLFASQVTFPAGMHELSISLASPATTCQGHSLQLRVHAAQDNLTPQLIFSDSTTGSSLVWHAGAAELGVPPLQWNRALSPAFAERRVHLRLTAHGLESVSVANNHLVALVGKQVGLRTLAVRRPGTQELLLVLSALQSDIMHVMSSLTARRMPVCNARAQLLVDVQVRQVTESAVSLRDPCTSWWASSVMVIKDARSGAQLAKVPPGASASLQLPATLGKALPLPGLAGAWDDGSRAWVRLVLNAGHSAVEFSCSPPSSRRLPARPYGFQQVASAMQIQQANSSRLQLFFPATLLRELPRWVHVMPRSLRPDAVHMSVSLLPSFVATEPVASYEADFVLQVQASLARVENALHLAPAAILRYESPAPLQAELSAQLNGSAWYNWSVSSDHPDVQLQDADSGLVQRLDRQQPRRLRTLAIELANVLLSSTHTCAGAARIQACVSDVSLTGAVHRTWCNSSAVAVLGVPVHSKLSLLANATLQQWTPVRAAISEPACAAALMRLTVSVSNGNLSRLATASVTSCPAWQASQGKAYQTVCIAGTAASLQQALQYLVWYPMAENSFITLVLHNATHQFDRLQSAAVPPMQASLTALISPIATSIVQPVTQASDITAVQGGGQGLPMLLVVSAPAACSFSQNGSSTWSMFGLPQAVRSAWQQQQLRCDTVCGAVGGVVELQAAVCPALPCGPAALREQLANSSEARFIAVAVPQHRTSTQSELTATNVGSLRLSLLAPSQHPPTCRGQIGNYSVSASLELATVGSHTRTGRFSVRAHTSASQFSQLLEMLELVASAGSSEAYLNWTMQVGSYVHTTRQAVDLSTIAGTATQRPCTVLARQLPSSSGLRLLVQSEACNGYDIVSNSSISLVNDSGVALPPSWSNGTHMGWSMPKQHSGATAAADSWLSPDIDDFTVLAVQGWNTSRAPAVIHRAPAPTAQLLASASTSTCMAGGDCLLPPFTASGTAPLQSTVTVAVQANESFTVRGIQSSAVPRVAWQQHNATRWQVSTSWALASSVLAGSAFSWAAPADTVIAVQVSLENQASVTSIHVLLRAHARARVTLDDSVPCWTCAIPWPRISITGVRDDGVHCIVSAVGGQIQDAAGHALLLPWTASPAAIQALLASSTWAQRKPNASVFLACSHPADLNGVWSQWKHDMQLGASSSTPSSPRWRLGDVQPLGIAPLVLSDWASVDAAASDTPDSWAGLEVRCTVTNSSCELLLLHWLVLELEVQGQLNLQHGSASLSGWTFSSVQLNGTATSMSQWLPGMQLIQGCANFTTSTATSVVSTVVCLAEAAAEAGAFNASQAALAAMLDAQSSDMDSGFLPYRPTQRLLPSVSSVLAGSWVHLPRFEPGPCNRSTFALQVQPNMLQMPVSGTVSLQNMTASEYNALASAALLQAPSAAVIQPAPAAPWKATLAMPALAFEAHVSTWTRPVGKHVQLLLACQANGTALLNITNLEAWHSKPWAACGHQVNLLVIISRGHVQLAVDGLEQGAVSVVSGTLDPSQSSALRAQVRTEQGSWAIDAGTHGIMAAVATSQPYFQLSATAATNQSTIAGDLLTSTELLPLMLPATWQAAEVCAATAVSEKCWSVSVPGLQLSAVSVALRAGEPGCDALLELPVAPRNPLLALDMTLRLREVDGAWSMLLPTQPAALATQLADMQAALGTGARAVLHVRSTVPLRTNSTAWQLHPVQHELGVDVYDAILVGSSAWRSLPEQMAELSLTMGLASSGAPAHAALSACFSDTDTCTVPIILNGQELLRAARVQLPSQGPSALALTSHCLLPISQLGSVHWVRPWQGTPDSTLLVHVQAVQCGHSCLLSAQGKLTTHATFSGNSTAVAAQLRRVRVFSSRDEVTVLASSADGRHRCEFHGQPADPATVAHHYQLEVTEEDIIPLSWRVTWPFVDGLCKLGLVLHNLTSSSHSSTDWQPCSRAAAGASKLDIRALPTSRNSSASLSIQLLQQGTGHTLWHNASIAVATSGRLRFVSNGSPIGESEQADTLLVHSHHAERIDLSQRAKQPSLGLTSERGNPLVRVMLMADALRLAIPAAMAAEFGLHDIACGLTADNVTAAGCMSAQPAVQLLARANELSRWLLPWINSAHVWWVRGSSSFLAVRVTSARHESAAAAVLLQVTRQQGALLVPQLQCSVPQDHVHSQFNLSTVLSIAHTNATEQVTKWAVALVGAGLAHAGGRLAHAQPSMSLPAIVYVRQPADLLRSVQLQFVGDLGQGCVAVAAMPCDVAEAGQCLQSSSHADSLSAAAVAACHQGHSSPALSASFTCAAHVSRDARDWQASWNHTWSSELGADVLRLAVTGYLPPSQHIGVQLASGDCIVSLYSPAGGAFWAAGVGELGARTWTALNASSVLLAGTAQAWKQGLVIDRSPCLAALDIVQTEGCAPDSGCASLQLSPAAATTPAGSAALTIADPSIPHCTGYVVKAGVTVANLGKLVRVCGQASAGAHFTLDREFKHGKLSQVNGSAWALETTERYVVASAFESVCLASAVPELLQQTQVSAISDGAGACAPASVFVNAAALAGSCTPRSGTQISIQAGRAKPRVLWQTSPAQTSAKPGLFGQSISAAGVQARVPLLHGMGDSWAYLDMWVSGTCTVSVRSSPLVAMVEQVSTQHVRFQCQLQHLQQCTALVYYASMTSEECTLRGAVLSPDIAETAEFTAPMPGASQPSFELVWPAIGSVSRIELQDSNTSRAFLGARVASQHGASDALVGARVISRAAAPEPTTVEVCCSDVHLHGQKYILQLPVQVTSAAAGCLRLHGSVTVVNLALSLTAVELGGKQGSCSIQLLSADAGAPGLTAIFHLGHETEASAATASALEANISTLSGSDTQDFQVQLRPLASPLVQGASKSVTRLVTMSLPDKSLWPSTEPFAQALLVCQHCDLTMRPIDADSWMWNVSHTCDDVAARHTAQLLLSGKLGVAASLASAQCMLITAHPDMLSLILQRTLVTAWPASDHVALVAELGWAGVPDSWSRAQDRVTVSRSPDAPALTTTLAQKWYSADELTHTIDDIAAPNAMLAEAAYDEDQPIPLRGVFALEDIGSLPSDEYSVQIGVGYAGALSTQRISVRARATEHVVHVDLGHPDSMQAAHAILAAFTVNSSQYGSVHSATVNVRTKTVPRTQDEAVDIAAQASPGASVQSALSAGMAAWPGIRLVDVSRTELAPAMGLHGVRFALHFLREPDVALQVAIATCDAPGVGSATCTSSTRSLPNHVSGSFVLQATQQGTVPIPHNASAEFVQHALQQLVGIRAVHVERRQTPGCQFSGALTWDVAWLSPAGVAPMLVMDASELQGDHMEVSVAWVQAGYGQPAVFRLQTTTDPVWPRYQAVIASQTDGLQPASELQGWVVLCLHVQAHYEELQQCTEPIAWDAPALTSDEGYNLDSGYSIQSKLVQAQAALAAQLEAGPERERLLAVAWQVELARPSAQVLNATTACGALVQSTGVAEAACTAGVVWTITALDAHPSLLDISMERNFLFGATDFHITRVAQPFAISGQIRLAYGQAGEWHVPYNASVSQLQSALESAVLAASAELRAQVGSVHVFADLAVDVTGASSWTVVFEQYHPDMLASLRWDGALLAPQFGGARVSWYRISAKPSFDVQVSGQYGFISELQVPSACAPGLLCVRAVRSDIVAAQQALDSMVVQPAADWFGLLVIQAQVCRLAGGGMQAPCSQALFHVAVRPVNDPPTMVVPARVQHSLMEDVQTPLSGIHVEDPDASIGTVEVIVAVQLGTLLIGNQASSGKHSQAFVGSLAHVNHMLDLLVYAPLPNYQGVDSVLLVVNDNGNLGSVRRQDNAALLAAADSLVQDMVNAHKFLLADPLTCQNCLIDAKMLDLVIPGTPDAPRIDAPRVHACTEDMLCIIPGISLHDADGNNDPPVLLSIFAFGGKVQLTRRDGLQFDTRPDQTLEEPRVDSAYAAVPNLLHVTAKRVTIFGQLSSANDLLKQLQFIPNINFYGTAFILLRLDDRVTARGVPAQLPLDLNSTHSFLSLVAVQVSAVRDRPIVQVPPEPLVMFEDTVAAVRGAAVFATDAVVQLGTTDMLLLARLADEFGWDMGMVNTDQQNDGLTLAMLAPDGALMCWDLPANLTLSAGSRQYGSALVLSGSPQQLNRALATLQYRPSLNANSALRGHMDVVLLQVSAGLDPVDNVLAMGIADAQRLADSDAAMQALATAFRKPAALSLAVSLSGQAEVIAGLGYAPNELGDTEQRLNFAVPDTAIAALQFEVLPAQDAPVLAIANETLHETEHTGDDLSAAATGVPVWQVWEDTPVRVPTMHVRDVDIASPAQIDAAATSELIPPAASLLSVKLASSCGQLRLGSTQDAGLPRSAISSAEPFSVVHREDLDVVQALGDALHLRGLPGVLNAALQDLVFFPQAGFWGSCNITVTVSDEGAGGALVPWHHWVGSNASVPIDVQQIPLYLQRMTDLAAGGIRLANTATSPSQWPYLPTLSLTAAGDLLRAAQQANLSTHTASDGCADAVDLQRVVQQGYASYGGDVSWSEWAALEQLVGRASCDTVAELLVAFNSTADTLDFVHAMPQSHAASVGYFVTLAAVLNESVPLMDVRTMPVYVQPVNNPVRFNFSAEWLDAVEDSAHMLPVQLTDVDQYAGMSVWPENIDPVLLACGANASCSVPCLSWAQCYTSVTLELYTPSGWFEVADDSPSVMVQHAGRSRVSVRGLVPAVNAALLNSLLYHPAANENSMTSSDTWISLTTTSWGFGSSTTAEISSEPVQYSHILPVRIAPVNDAPLLYWAGVQATAGARGSLPAPEWPVVAGTVQPLSWLNLTDVEARECRGDSSYTATVYVDQGKLQLRSVEVRVEPTPRWVSQDGPSERYQASGVAPHTTQLPLDMIDSSTWRAVPSVSFSGSLDRVRAALQSLEYLAPAQGSGLAVLGVTVQDSGCADVATSAFQVSTVMSSMQVPVRIVPANARPELSWTLPIDAELPEDSRLRLAHLVVSDSDAQDTNHSLVLRLLVSSGTLAVASAAGGVASTGHAARSEQELQGTVAQLNAALQMTTYEPAPSSTAALLSEPAWLNATISDGGCCAGHGLSEVVLSSQLVVKLPSPVPVASQPGITLPQQPTAPNCSRSTQHLPTQQCLLLQADAHTWTYEDSALALAGVHFSDADGSAQFPAWAELSMFVAHGSVAFPALAGSSVWHRGMPALSSELLTVEATVASLDDAIQAAEFTPAANFWGTANITFVLTDLASSPPQTVTRVWTIAVLPINDPVSLHLESAPSHECHASPCIVRGDARNHTLLPLLRIEDADAAHVPCQSMQLHVESSGSPVHFPWPWPGVHALRGHNDRTTVPDFTGSQSTAARTFGYTPDWASYAVANTWPAVHGMVSPNVWLQGCMADLNLLLQHLAVEPQAGSQSLHMVVNVTVVDAADGQDEGATSASMILEVRRAARQLVYWVTATDVPTKATAAAKSLPTVAAAQGGTLLLTNFSLRAQGCADDPEVSVLVSSDVGVPSISDLQFNLANAAASAWAAVLAPGELLAPVHHVAALPGHHDAVDGPTSAVQQQLQQLTDGAATLSVRGRLDLVLAAMQFVVVRVARDFRGAGSVQLVANSTQCPTGPTAKLTLPVTVFAVNLAPVVRMARAPDGSLAHRAVEGMPLKLRQIAVEPAATQTDASTAALAPRSQMMFARAQRVDSWQDLQQTVGQPAARGGDEWRLLDLTSASTAAKPLHAALLPGAPYAAAAMLLDNHTTRSAALLEFGRGVAIALETPVLGQLQPVQPAEFTWFDGRAWFSAQGADLSWIAVDNTCGGMREAAVTATGWLRAAASTSILSTEPYAHVYYVTANTATWQPGALYDCPRGMRWLSTMEAQSVFPGHSSQVQAPLTAWDLPKNSTAETPGHPSAVPAHADVCGWQGTQWRGLSRVRFRFADSHLTGAAKFAGDADWATPVLQDFDTTGFAGIVCAQMRAGEPRPGSCASLGCHEQAGRELWSTQGTPQSTARFQDLASGAQSSAPHGFTILHDALGAELRMLFAASTQANGIELWQLLPGASGASLLVDIVPGAVSAAPTDLVAMSHDAYPACFAMLSATSLDGDRELYRVCGQDAELVINLCERCSSSPAGATVLPGTSTVLFAATSDDAGRELWASNGTSESTVLVMDAVPGAGSSSPLDLVAFDGAVWFSAETLMSGRELWRSDGTAAGTRMIKDLLPGSGSSRPRSFTVLPASGSEPDMLLFHASTDPIQRGTDVGDTTLYAIRAGSTTPLAVIDASGGVYFTLETEALAYAAGLLGSHRLSASTGLDAMMSAGVRMVPSSGGVMFPALQASNEVAPQAAAAGTLSLSEALALPHTSLLVSDPDGASTDELHVRLEVSHGSLRLPQVQAAAQAGLVQVLLPEQATVEGSAAWKLAGTAAGLATALESMVYSSQPDFVGSDELLVNASDLGLPGAASQQPAWSALHVPIEVYGYNDAPVITWLSSMSVLHELAEAMDGPVISDVDQRAGTAIDSSSVPVHVRLTVTAGRISIDSLVGMHVMSGTGLRDTELEVQAPLAVLNARMARVEYVCATADGCTPGTYSILVEVSDLPGQSLGAAASASHRVQVVVLPS